MKIENMKDIMSIAHQSRNAVHMIGEAGIGKTEIVKQFAKDAGFHVEVLQLTVMDTGDLIGMPLIDTDKSGAKVTTWAKPVWLQRVNQANEAGKNVVIFLDELGRASIDIRQASLQMVLEGKIQEHSLGFLNDLPSLIVVADNPSDTYDTEEFDQALEDRFITLNVETSITGFLKYARTAGIMSVVTDYLAEHPEKLLFKPEDTAEKGSTPRAWEALSRILKVLPETNTKGADLTYTLIASKIGKTVGASFHHYLNTYTNVVSIKDIKKLIGKSKMETEEEQRAARSLLEETTRKMEVISAGELAEKMLTACKEDEKKVSVNLILAFVSSLHIEVAAGILKTWKVDEKEWYIEKFSKVQGKGRWFARELLANVED